MIIESKLFFITIVAHVFVILQEVNDFFFILHSDKQPSFIQHFHLQHSEENDISADDDDCMEINIVGSHSFNYFIEVIVVGLTLSIILGVCIAICTYLAIKKLLCKSKKNAQVPASIGQASSRNIYVSTVIDLRCL